MNLDECQKSCLKNGSCAAYANLDIRDGGSGCLLWFNTLVDLGRFSQWGQDFYIRVPASELGTRSIFYFHFHFCLWLLRFVLWFEFLLIIV